MLFIKSTVGVFNSCQCGRGGGGGGGGGQSLVLCYCVDPAKNIGEPNLINGMLITITIKCLYATKILFTSGMFPQYSVLCILWMNQGQSHVKFKAKYATFVTQL